jgi:hypothetical protein
MRGAGRRLPVSFLLLIACHGPPPPPTGAGATGALETPSADASGAGCGTPTGDADEGSFEQRTFREVLVGALRFPAKRLTWILFRSPGHARLRMLCQNSVHTPPLGLSLDGKENGESVWSVPSIVEYTGLAGPGLAYDLSTASQPSGLPGCEPPHVRLQLRCHEGRVEVLAAGEALIARARGLSALRRARRGRSRELQTYSRPQGARLRRG